MAVKTFANNEVLTAADTNTYLANSGLVYIDGGSVSGQTKLTKDGCFTSSFDNYRLVLSKMSVSTADRAFRINYRASGSTNASANYDYGFNGYKANGTTNNTGLAGQTFAEIGVFIGTFAGADLGSCSIDIYSPKLTSTRTHATSVAQGYEGAYYWRSGGFVQGSTDSFDGFEISLSGSGNLSFTWRLYGYRQA